jgi:hypothetical protein
MGARKRGARDKGIPKAESVRLKQPKKDSSQCFRDKGPELTYLAENI